MSEALAHLFYTDKPITIMIEHAKRKLKVFLIDELCLVWCSIHELRIANLPVAVLVYSTEDCLPITSLPFLIVLIYDTVNLHRKFLHLLPADETIVVCVHRLELFSKLTMIRLVALIPHEETKYAFLETSRILSLLQAWTKRSESLLT